MSNTIDKSELKEVLASLMAEHNFDSRYIGQCNTKLYYKKMYCHGKESADFIRMIDSFEDSKEYYTEQLKYYQGRCWAYANCIKRISQYFDIDIEFEEVKTEFMYYFENKGYFLPLKYNEFVFKKD